MRRKSLFALRGFLRGSLKTHGAAVDLRLLTDRKQIPQLYSSKVVPLNDIMHMSPGEIAAFHLKVKDDLLYVDSKRVNHVVNQGFTWYWLGGNHICFTQGTLNVALTFN